MAGSLGQPGASPKDLTRTRRPDRRTILALDLGKFNTVACVYEQAGGDKKRCQDDFITPFFVTVYQF